MDIINREYYTQRIANAFGKGLIIALTGQRRVGKSYIMLQIINEIKAKENANVIYVNLDYEKFSGLKTHIELSQYVEENLQEGKDNYFFADEIQNVKEFEKTLRNLHAQNLCHIMITGSNAKMLSGELTTFLSGRCIEYHIQSLSFKEFLLFHNLPNSQESLAKYLQFGGLPQLRTIGLDNTSLIDDYLEGIYNMIVLKDVIEREDIRNVPLLKDLLRFTADNIGKQFSANKIVGFLKNQNIVTSSKAILSYLEYLSNAFIINKVPRYDIHGKRLFELNDKYYFEDLGLRNKIIGGNRRADIEKVIENAVYLHLKHLGYTVNVGQFMKAEIDFVAEKKGQTIYIQVTYLLATQETIDREFGNLKIIKNSFPKYVISMDTLFGNTNDDGIRHINLLDFLNMDNL